MDEEQEGNSGGSMPAASDADTNAADTTTAVTITADTTTAVANTADTSTALTITADNSSQPAQKVRHCLFHLLIDLACSTLSIQL